MKPVVYVDMEITKKQFQKQVRHSIISMIINELIKPKSEYI